MGDVIQFHSNAEYQAAIDKYCEQCAGPTNTIELVARCDHLCPLWAARPYKDGHELGESPHPLHKMLRPRQRGEWPTDDWRS